MGDFAKLQTKDEDDATERMGDVQSEMGFGRI
jgi:hypothetical protein